MGKFVLLLLAALPHIAFCSEVRSEIAATAAQSLPFWTSTWIYQENEDLAFLSNNPNSSFQRVYIIYAAEGKIENEKLTYSFHYALRQRDFQYRSGTRYFQPMFPKISSDRLLLIWPGRGMQTAPLLANNNRGKIQFQYSLRSLLSEKNFRAWQAGEEVGFFFDVKYGTFRGFVNNDLNYGENFSSSEGKFIIQVWLKK
jgi:hypothetical protein